MPPAAAKLEQEHLTIFDGQHEIDDHQVGQSNLALRQCRADVADGDDDMSLLLEQDLEHVPYGGIVIEHENRFVLRHIRILTAGEPVANMRSLPTSELLSSPDMTLRLRAVGAALSLLVACAGNTPPSPQHVALVPSDLYPLQTGNAWSYDVDTGETSTTLAITRVEAFDGRVAEVHTGHSLVRYEVLPEGIRVLPGDAWLIRAPLEEGETWPGRAGRSARLVSTHATFATRAGTFDRCVEVVETGGKRELEVRTVYCPGVGPVAVDSTMRSKVSDRVLTVSARLRGYDVSPLRSADR